MTHIEFPKHYPDIKTFVTISRIIRNGESPDTNIDQRKLARVQEIMTPEILLHGTSFEQPEAINPQKYHNFEALLENRERIRNLELLPIKTDEDRSNYHAYSARELRAMIDTYLQESPLALELNAFPYFLPLDVEQYIVWIKDPNINREEVAKFITKALDSFAISTEKVILFERPLHTGTKMVRGTIPDYRHVHLWIKGRNRQIFRED